VAPGFRSPVPNFSTRGAVILRSAVGATHCGFGHSFKSRPAITDIKDARVLRRFDLGTLRGASTTCAGWLLA